MRRVSVSIDEVVRARLLLDIVTSVIDDLNNLGAAYKLSIETTKKVRAFERLHFPNKKEPLNDPRY